MTPAETRAHSAAHVLKGAVVRVLGPRATASVHAGEGRGRLTVVAEARPSAEEVAAIEREANRKMDENAELIEFEMERQEAEAHFGPAIYDAFPVPADVTILKMVRIPDWEVNCCREAHVDSTGEIGRLRLDGSRYRGARRQLELEFSLG